MYTYIEVSIEKLKNLHAFIIASVTSLQLLLQLKTQWLSRNNWITEICGKNLA